VAGYGVFELGSFIDVMERVLWDGQGEKKVNLSRFTGNAGGAAFLSLRDIAKNLCEAMARLFKMRELMTD